MEPGLKKALLITSIVITFGVAGGLVASTAVAARAYQSRYELPRKAEQTLTVTGSARKRIRSDLAIWRIRVTGDGKDLKSAYAVLKTGVDRVNTFLEVQKFKPDEIAPGSIDTQMHYARDWHGRETEDVASYTLSRTCTITTPRVDAVSTPSGEVTELIRDGVSVVSSAPEYIYSKLADLKIEMIGEASKDARTRADQIVSNAGCVITEVRTARMGVLQITRPNSTEVSGSGVNDTSTIEKDVTSVVSLTLGLGPK